MSFREIIVPQSVRSLDDIINLTIHVAQTMGYSLQQLRERVRDRLASPDHILVVDRDRGCAKSCVMKFGARCHIRYRHVRRRIWHRIPASRSGPSQLLLSIPSEEPTNFFRRIARWWL